MTSQSQHIIELRNLNIGYHGNTVVSGISTCVDSPAVIALIGPNGAGKSTLLKTITGELKPCSGEVFIKGRKATDYSRRQLAHILSLVTTDNELSSGGLRVREMVSIGRHPFTGFFGKFSDADKRIVDDAMERVGIAHKSDCFVGNLSDGERQKAMIARALAQDTPLICLDEPFSFLDPTARIEIFLMMRREAAENGKLIILSTHDVAQALRFADKLWMIGAGRFFASTPQNADTASIIETLFQSDAVKFSSEIMDFLPRKRF